MTTQVSPKIDEFRVIDTDERVLGEVQALIDSNEATVERVLDIGCGNGLRAGRINAKEVWGVEASLLAINRARGAFPEKTFLMWSLTEHAFEFMGKFDLVLITDILYRPYIEGHEDTVMSNITTLMRPKGFLLMSHINGMLYMPIDGFRLLKEYEYPHGEHIQKFQLYRKKGI